MKAKGSGFEGLEFRNTNILWYITQDHIMLLYSVYCPSTLYSICDYIGGSIICLSASGCIHKKKLLYVVVGSILTGMMSHTFQTA